MGASEPEAPSRVMALSLREGVESGSSEPHQEAASSLDRDWLRDGTCSPPSGCKPLVLIPGTASLADEANVWMASAAFLATFRRGGGGGMPRPAVRVAPAVTRPASPPWLPVALWAAVTGGSGVAAEEAAARSRGVGGHWEGSALEHLEDSSERTEGSARLP